jgi:hypothetical protein
MSWKIPKIWKDGECWIIGGGPSMPRQFGIPEEVISKVYTKEATPEIYSPYLSHLHDKHVIGINAAYLIGNWIDFVLFGDYGFYTKNEEALLKYPKTVISCCEERSFKKLHSAIKYVKRNRRQARGLTIDNPYMISWNGNTGAAGINLAVLMGAKKIYLLGFDMKLDESKYQHWHSEYKSFENRGKFTQPKKLPFRNHLPGFNYIHKNAKKHGIEIINVSPDSAITEFPKVSLKDLL